MESLTWISHPAKERPFTAVLVLIFIVLVMTMVYYFMERSLFMMIIAGVIFVFSLSTFFSPTTYTVDETKVSIKYRFSVKERNLSAFRKCYPDRRGILISPYISPSRLENFRGFYLRYGKNNKAEVDEFVKKLIDKQRAETGLETDEVKPDAI